MDEIAAAPAAAESEHRQSGCRSSPILNRILWVLRTGASWRDVPDRYGPSGTISSRLYQWRKAGIWDRVVAAEGRGKPMTFLVTAGQEHDAVWFEPLMQQGVVKRLGPGRPRPRPQRVVGDKGYSTRRIRLYCRGRGIRITIPRRSN